LGRVLGMEPWPHDAYFTPEQFNALPVAQQRLIALLVRALIEYLERQPWNADVIALLWEIKRMRSMLLRLHQVSGDLQRPGGITGGIYDELLDAPGKPRKGMAPR